MKDGVVAYAVRQDGDVTVPYPASMGTGSREVAEYAVRLNGGEVVALVVQPAPLVDGVVLREFKRAWAAADERGEVGSRTAAGLLAVIPMIEASVRARVKKGF